VESPFIFPGETGGKNLEAMGRVLEDSFLKGVFRVIAGE
jgi:hypothetical protein